MSRKKRDYRRQDFLDPIYKSKHVGKFINKVMMSGKKSTAQNIVYKAIEKLAASVNTEPLEAFNKSLKNVMPLMEVKSRRVGGSTYQVPVEVRNDRALALAMRWVISNSRSRSGSSMIDRLASELIDSFNGVGSSIKKREDTHKMAESNKAFAHFRW